MSQTTESPDDFKTEYPDWHEVNATFAARFLVSISKGEPITIVCIGAKPPSGGGPVSVIPRTFDPLDPEDVKRMRSFIASQEMLPNNVYYVANIAKTEGIMPKNKDMGALRAIVIDFDPDKTKPLEEERDRLRRRAYDIQNAPVKPRAIVNTGGGMQVVYELLKPIPFDDEFIKKTEDLMKRLAKSQGADTTTCSANHLFRVPYTYNWPNDKKEQAGRTKSVSSLWYAEGPRVAFEDLEALTTVSTDDEPEFTPPNFEDLEPKDLVGVVGVPENLPAELIDKARDPDIQKAVHREPKDGDRSKGDWFMAKTLIGLGLSDKDTALLLAAYGNKTQAAYDRSRDDGRWLWTYVTNTVDAARREFQKTTDKLDDFEKAADQQERAKERQERHARLKLLTYEESIDGIFDPVNSSLIAGLIQRGEVMVLYGKPSAGKTFAMLDLSFHIALGRDWNECKVKQSSVVYIATEASLGIRYRIKALGDRYGAPEPDRFRLVPTAVDMFNRHVDLDKLIAEISKVEGEIGLIVIDTLSRSMMGGNENSAQDMMTLVKHGDLLRNKFGAALAWVHHSGKNEAAGARGSSALLAAVDVELEVADRCFRSTKMRDREHVDYRFELRVVDVGTMNESGDKVTSCIVDWQKGLTDTGGMTEESRTTSVAVELLRDRGNTTPMTAKAIWELADLLKRRIPVKSYHSLAKALDRSFKNDGENIFTREISATPRRNQNPVDRYGLVDW